MRDNCNVDTARSGTVEFTEVYPLPRAKRQRAVLYYYGFGTAHHRRFDMRGGIAFHVPIPVFERDALIQFHLDVGRH